MAGGPRVDPEHPEESIYLIRPLNALESPRKHWKSLFRRGIAAEPVNLMMTKLWVRGRKWIDGFVGGWTLNDMIFTLEVRDLHAILLQHIHFLTKPGLQFQKHFVMILVQMKIYGLKPFSHLNSRLCLQNQAWTLSRIAPFTHVAHNRR